MKRTILSNLAIAVLSTASVVLLGLVIFLPNRFEPIKDIDEIIVGDTTTEKNGCCYLRCYRLPCSFEASECGSGSTCIKDEMLQPHVRSAACAKDNNEDDNKPKTKNCKLTDTDKENVKAVYCRIIGPSPVGVECPTGQVRCMIKTANDIPENEEKYELVYIEPESESLNNSSNGCSNTNSRDNKDQRSEKWAYECRSHL
jgi:hypothetical protein